MLDGIISFFYDGLWWKWLFTLKNVRKNDWKLIIGGGRGSWNKDVLGGKKIDKLTIGVGGTIIRDSRVIDSDVKEVKKQLRNPPKPIDDEKTQMTQIIGLIKPMLT